MKTGSGKVLLYSINFAPELTGIGKYNGEMVRWLAERGYQVRVITAPPYYPQWNVPSGYSAARYAREEWHGARIWRCPVWVPKRVSGMKRLLHLFSYAVSSFPVLLRQMLWRPDLIFVVEPPLMLSPMTVGLAKLLRIRSWLHVQDFEVDAAFELGLLPDRKWLKRWVGRLENVFMRGFDVVSSISEPMIRRLEAKGIRPERIRHFPNWVDTRSIRPLGDDEPNRLREEMGYVAGEVVALYSGNMGEKQGLETVIEAAERLLAHPRIRFVLCGDGVSKEKLKAQAERLKLTNVRFLPLQPEERLNELLGMADIHLLVQKRKSSDLVMPSKLCGMMASGKPVIATAEQGTAVHAVMQRSGAGLLVPPENSEKLADSLRQLAVREDDRLAFGQSARRFAEHHLGYESVLMNFHQSVEELGVGLNHEPAEKPHSIGSI